jgi:hypothetical protein
MQPAMMERFGSPRRIACSQGKAHRSGNTSVLPGWSRESRQC